MCGIAGAIWWNATQSIDVTVLQRMSRAIAHRGPDDHGLFCRSFPAQSTPNSTMDRPHTDVVPTEYEAYTKSTSGVASAPDISSTAGVALAHQRLSILDLAGGHQPLSNEDDTVWIVFNGEIYNYRELRCELESRGHRFRTQSDTEVIVHLYEEYGDDFARRLNGMFAIAMIDLRRRSTGHARLLLVRDRLGEKPLVYCQQEGRLAFASEIKALLEIPGLPRSLDPEAVDLFLTYQYVPHPATIYQDIRKLSPGEILLCELAPDGTAAQTLRRYWNPDWTDESHGRSEADWIDELRETLSDAVRIRLESDVPLGTFLSGGVDSTIIAGLVQRISGTRIRTFSIGFPESAYDETAYAREAAAFLGTDHTELQVQPDTLAILPKLTYHYDEPFADSSAVPTWSVSEITRRKVTVALTGDGGDELFGGYRRYRATQLGSYFDRLPRPLRAAASLAFRLAQQLPIDRSSRNIGRQALRFLEMLHLPPLERYLQWIAIFHAQQRRELYRPEFYERILQTPSRMGNPYPDHRSLWFLEQAAAQTVRKHNSHGENIGTDGDGRIRVGKRAIRGRDAVSTVSIADIQTYLPCDILAKVDTASMAHALETRPPLLDYRLVELAASMPVELKLRHGRGKYIFRKAFAEFLPDSIQRRAKQGFGVPLEHWFRGPLRPLLETTLLSSRTLERPFFQPDTVRRLVAEHLDGRFDHAYRLWALLIFERWYRRWIENDLETM